MFLEFPLAVEEGNEVSLLGVTESGFWSSPCAIMLSKKGDRVATVVVSSFPVLCTDVVLEGEASVLALVVNSLPRSKPVLSSLGVANCPVLYTGSSFPLFSGRRSLFPCVIILETPVLGEELPSTKGSALSGLGGRRLADD